ncbi:MAG TPA: hypothetical protein VKR06_32990 [Ktedonosporobacter sp.]|nr:hypothetical protein [Ktedonosporobacter sp.]
MSSRTVKIGGWILLIGAVISIGATALQFVIPGPLGQNGPPSTVVTVVNVIAGLLLLGGLPAVYRAKSKQLGTLGLLGIVAIWLTALLFDLVLGIITILVVSKAPASSLSGAPPPALFALFIVGTVLQLLGGLLLGLRIIQTGAFPKLIGWFLIAGGVLAAISFPLDGVSSTIVNTLSSLLFFVALGWLGYAIATQVREAARPPASSATEG